MQNAFHIKPKQIHYLHGDGGMKKAQLSIFLVFGVIFIGIFVLLLAFAGKIDVNIPLKRNPTFSPIIGSIESCKYQASQCYLKTISENDAGLELDMETLEGRNNNFQNMLPGMQECIGEIPLVAMEREEKEIIESHKFTMDSVDFFFDDESTLQNDESKVKVGKSFININWPFSHFMQVRNTEKPKEPEFDLSSLHKTGLIVTIYEIHDKPVYELTKKTTTDSQKFYFIK
jgi:hypothetical protein